MKIVEQCLDILKRDDIKQEIRKLTSIVLYEINPYIYIIIMKHLLKIVKKTGKVFYYGKHWLFLTIIK